MWIHSSKNCLLACFFFTAASVLCQILPQTPRLMYCWRKTTVVRGLCIYSILIYLCIYLHYRVFSYEAEHKTPASVSFVCSQTAQYHCCFSHIATELGLDWWTNETGGSVKRCWRNRCRVWPAHTSLNNQEHLSWFCIWFQATLAPLYNHPKSCQAVCSSIFVKVIRFSILPTKRFCWNWYVCPKTPTFIVSLTCKTKHFCMLLL